MLVTGPIWIITAPPSMVIVGSGGDGARCSGRAVVCASMHSAVNSCDAHWRKRPPYSGVGCINRQRQSLCWRPLQRERNRCANQRCTKGSAKQAELFHDIAPRLLVAARQAKGETNRTITRLRSSRRRTTLSMRACWPVFWYRTRVPVTTKGHRTVTKVPNFGFERKTDLFTEEGATPHSVLIVGGLSR